MIGKRLTPGDPIGEVAALDHLTATGLLDQSEAANQFLEHKPTTEIRLAGLRREDYTQELTGTIQSWGPAAVESIRDSSLGTAGSAAA